MIIMKFPFLRWILCKVWMRHGATDRLRCERTSVRLPAMDLSENGFFDIPLLSTFYFLLSFCNSFHYKKYLRNWMKIIIIIIIICDTKSRFHGPLCTDLPCHAYLKILEKQKHFDPANQTWRRTSRRGCFRMCRPLSSGKSDFCRNRKRNSFGRCTPHRSSSSCESWRNSGPGT